ncbi:MAG: aspartyl/asparaginyl beta-hydroxylase domain-containing protein [Pseudolabrys sp.]
MRNQFGNIGQVTPKKLAVLAALAASGRTPVVKPEHFREICTVDICSLLRDVRGIGDAEWDVENEKKENNFSCFRQTRHIIGRFNNGPHPEGYHATAFWERWSDHLVPVMRTVAAHYDLAEADYSKVMLARLAAGGKVDSHSDIGVSNHLTHKIHVPLVTNKNVWFQVGGERFQLETGKAYELNNIRCIPSSMVAPMIASIWCSNCSIARQRNQHQAILRNTVSGYSAPGISRLSGPKIGQRPVVSRNRKIVWKMPPAGVSQRRKLLWRMTRSPPGRRQRANPSIVRAKSSNWIR